MRGAVVSSGLTAPELVGLGSIAVFRSILAREYSIARAPSLAAPAD